jgi:hypothetical protein
MRYLSGIGVKALKDLDIERITNGHDLTSSCGSYGAYTLHTKDGQEYVLWAGMGEVNLSKVREK